MARINLKNIVGKRNEITAVVLALIEQLKVEIWVEDDAGKLLLGNPTEKANISFPVNLDDEIIGWVKRSEERRVGKECA